MTLLSQVWAVFSVLAITSTMAAPLEVTVSSTLRYTPGEDLSGIRKSMTYDSGSIFNLGSDGVLRAFANNLTVVDYRQLDPDQVKMLVSMQMAQLRASGFDLPSSMMKLIESPCDGRLITNIDDLLNPRERPNVARRSEVTPRSVETTDAESLFERQPQICPGSPACESLADCQVYNCQSCYFQNGPPAGTCFLD